MNLVVVNASKPDKHCIGPTGQYSDFSWVMNLDVVNVSKPHPAVICLMVYREKGFRNVLKSKA